jgi:hypothetical protein
MPHTLPIAPPTKPDPLTTRHSISAGPGALDFIQGDTQGTPFWRMVRSFISAPTPQQEACQAPKPILLNTGSMNIPYAWQPATTEIALLRAGQLLIACVPGELTTMAGRRLRKAIYDNVKVGLAAYTCACWRAGMPSPMLPAHSIACT